MTTTTTTLTTTVMATIDIPCSDGEVRAEAASEEDVGMATTQAQTGSSFTLGDRQDRVLTIDVGNVKITSTSVPEKDVTLTTKRWARFMSIHEKVDIKAREVNRQTRPVAYRAHIGELYYVSVTSRYGCVDIRRFYVPYGLASENVRTTRSGIGLRLEWAHLLELLPTIHEQHPELNVNAESSDEETDKKAIAQPRLYNMLIYKTSLR